MTKYLKKSVTTPAPKWFRKLRRVVYLLTSGSMLTGTLTRMGFSAEDCVFIVGWIMLALEALNLILVSDDDQDDDNLIVQPNENNG